MNKSIFIDYNSLLNVSFFKKITLKNIFDMLTSVRNIEKKRYIKFNDIEFIFLNDDHSHFKFPVNPFSISCTDIVKNACKVIDELDVFIESYVFDKHQRVTKNNNIKSATTATNPIKTSDLIITGQNSISKLHLENNYSYISDCNSNLMVTVDNLLMQKPDNLRLHLIEFRDPVLTNNTFDSVVYNFYTKNLESYIDNDMLFSAFSPNKIQSDINVLLETVKPKTIDEINFVNRITELLDIKFTDSTESTDSVTTKYLYFFTKLNNTITLYFRNRIKQPNTTLFENILMSYTDNKYIEVNLSDKNHKLIKEYLAEYAIVSNNLFIEFLLLIEKELKKYLDVDVKPIYNKDYTHLNLYESIGQELTQTNYNILICNLFKLLRITNVGVGGTNKLIIAIDDYLTMMRMFRIFRNRETKECEFIKKIIMIGGGYHTSDIYNCIKYLKALT